MKKTCFISLCVFTVLLIGIMTFYEHSKVEFEKSKNEEIEKLKFKINKQTAMLKILTELNIKIDHIHSCTDKLPKLYETLIGDVSVGE